MKEQTDLVLETNNQVLRGDDSNENLQVHEQMNPGDNNGLPYFSQDQQEPMGNFKGKYMDFFYFFLQNL